MGTVLGDRAQPSWRTRPWRTIAVLLPLAAAYAIAPLAHRWMRGTIWSHVYWGIAYASSGFAACWLLKRPIIRSLKVALVFAIAACFMMAGLYALSGYGDRYFHSAVSAARRGDFDRAEASIQASVNLYQRSPVEVGKAARLGWGGLVSDPRINGWLMLGNEALKARNNADALHYYLNAQEAANALGDRVTRDRLQEHITWLTSVDSTGDPAEVED